MPGGNDPIRLVFSVTLERPDFEVKLAKSTERPIVQVLVSGHVAHEGVVFTNMEASTDNIAPPEMHEIIESVFPVIGQLLQDVRSGKRKPNTAENRYYDVNTGERVPPAKLDS